ncbi:hypothetical protein [Streptomyces qinglanensis]|uniref:Uncharacterized protein n=1 Tax=Streptomyces qinglanensis TaxID=943816 RepID=A0A1H9NL97_9ACTN|nr:hypothetical protein [Streptomyces qinglanensis]SER36708.1 hypothetical protein SAMN05421870_101484 [Streptomyces qinglanensis]
MADDRDDPILIRSRWGTNDYVFNFRNPVACVVFVGLGLLVFGLLYASNHRSTPQWEEGELRSAVKGATAELSEEAQFGPGIPGYGEVLQSRIAKHGPHSESPHSSEHDAGVVGALASPQPEHDYFGESVEEADYTVTADGTDTALCLTVTALANRYGYSSVSFSIRNGSCPAT